MEFCICYGINECLGRSLVWNECLSVSKGDYVNRSIAIGFASVWYTKYSCRSILLVYAVRLHRDLAAYCSPLTTSLIINPFKVFIYSHPGREFNATENV